MIPGLLSHLLQSTLFAGAAWLLALALRKNRAQVRFWIFFTASAKFLIPFAALVSLGALAPRQETVPRAAAWVDTLEQMGAPLIVPAVAAQTAVQAATAASPIQWGTITFALWLCGFVTIIVSWLVRWQRVRVLRRSAYPLALEFPVPVMSAPGLLEPGVFGIFRPVLLLPEGIVGRLDPAELDAILAHEACHVRRRDNLTAAIHMAVQAIFWFHPLVWWLGARLVEERERACDEEVLAQGNTPRIYAAGILNVCRHYLESPLPCVSGVTGSNLRRRIDAILANRTARKLNYAGRMALSGTALAAIALPIAIGVIHAPVMRAQQAPAPMAQPQAKPDSTSKTPASFDAASVRPASIPNGATVLPGGGVVVPRDSGIAIPRNTGGPGTADPGRIHYPLITLRNLLRRAYPSYFQIVAPSWTDDELVQVDATMPVDTTEDQFQEMLRNLIANRFKLRFHTEVKQNMGYALVINKGGPKLKQSAEVPTPDGPDAPDSRSIPRTRQIGPDGFAIPRRVTGPALRLQSESGDRARMLGQEQTMQDLARELGRMLKSVVTNATGLTGKYDFTLTYAGGLGGPRLTPVSPGGSTSPATVLEQDALPDIFNALQSQLGLKLEARKIDVEVLAVDHIEKIPSAN